MRPGSNAKTGGSYGDDAGGSYGGGFGGESIVASSVSRDDRWGQDDFESRPPAGGLGRRNTGIGGKLEARVHSSAVKFAVNDDEADGDDDPDAIYDRLRMPSSSRSASSTKREEGSMKDKDGKSDKKKKRKVSICSTCVGESTQTRRRCR